MPNNINVKSLGTPSFLRYVVVNGNEFWDGSTWVADRKAAALYASFRDAVHDWRRLREADMNGTPQQRLESKVIVTVCADRLLDVDQLRLFLENNARLVVDLDEEPDDVVIDLWIDWNTLRSEAPTSIDPRLFARAVYEEFKRQLGCDPGDIDTALDPNRMRLLDWNKRPACKQIWINTVTRAMERLRREA